MSRGGSYLGGSTIERIGDPKYKNKRLNKRTPSINGKMPQAVAARHAVDVEDTLATPSLIVSKKTYDRRFSKKGSNRTANIIKMGSLGEQFVADHHITKGLNVVMAPSKFDSTKDMTIENNTVEVKTQVPWIIKDAFTVQPNQLKKCFRADYVYFVSVPTSMRKHHSDGKVYRVKEGNFKHLTEDTYDGRVMAVIPIKQLEYVFTLTPEQCKLLQDVSVSGWN